MDIATLQTCFEQAVDYYVDVQIPGRRYFNLSDIGSLDVDSSGYLYFTVWNLTDIAQPTNAVLQVPTAGTVLNWYKFNYTYVTAIVNSQYYTKIVGADLALMTAPAFDGFIAFNLTTSRLCRYDAATSTWIAF